MTCTQCGSNTPCGCFQGFSDPALPCCGPGQHVTPGGCCQPVVRAAPTPFYNCAPVCPENHTQRIVLQQYYASVSIADSWNVPLCGESAVVNIIGLKAIAPGAYIWNSQFGFFEITAFDAGTGQVTIQNNCNEGNAAAGTNVPGCTEFTVTVPPCDCGTDQQVCVAIDFTAPANGDCLDITLTNTTGLTVSDTIQIGTGFYFLEAIKPNDIVTICNQGSGITPGTPVIAKDANGRYQYCLSVISTNPCDRTAALQVKLLGCGNQGVTVPLDGNTGGWVATLINPTTNEAAYRPVGVWDGCTTVTSDFSIFGGTGNYADIPVADSTIFNNGSVVVFDGFPGFFFTISSKSDGTHISGDFTPVPGVDFTIPKNTTVCLESCCDANTDAIDSIYADENFINDVNPHEVNTTGGATSYDTAHTTWSVSNSSLTKTLRVLTNFVLNVSNQVAGDAIAATYLAVAYTINYKINGGATQSPVHNQTTTFSDPADDAIPQDCSFPWLNSFDILPGATATFEMWATIDVITQPAGGGGLCDISFISLAANQTGLPI